MLPAGLADRLRRLHLADTDGEDAFFDQSASTLSSASAEMMNGPPTAMPTAPTVLDELAVDEVFDTNHTDQFPTDIATQVSLESAPFSVFSGLAHIFFDPALAKFEQLLRMPLTDLDDMLCDPYLFPFNKICFTFPNGRDRYWDEDQGLWYTSTELRQLLATVYTRRLTLSMEAITEGCEIDEEQPIDHVLAELTAYLLSIENVYEPTGLSYSHFWVEDPNALHAFDELTEKQMVLHVIKDGQAMAAQTDPRVAYVHYLSRKEAAEGYFQFESVGCTSNHLYDGSW